MEEKKQRNKFYSASGCLLFRLCHDLWWSDAPGIQLGRIDKQL